MAPVMIILESAGDMKEVRRATGGPRHPAPARQEAARCQAGHVEHHRDANGPAGEQFASVHHGIIHAPQYACINTNNPVSTASTRLCQKTKRRIGPSWLCWP